MNFLGKVCLFAVVVLAVCFAESYVHTAYQRNATDLALQQLANDDATADALRTAEAAKNYLFSGLVVFIICAPLALMMFWRELRAVGGGLRRACAGHGLLLGLAAVALASGCRKYDVPEYGEIETHESAFLVPLEGDVGNQAAFASEKLLEERKIAVKRVQVPHRWSSTGRMWYDGNWIPTVKVIKVDRRPVTREWTAAAATGTSAKNEAIWVESKDSVTFAMGFTCTAHIPESKAATFLYRYPSKVLADIMDTEVRARVQQMVAEVAAKYNLDELRGKKNEMIDAVRKDVLPFFAERGMEITTLGMSNGMEYENKEIQRAIDKTVQDQQQKVTAEAKREAQLVENKTIKLAAEAKAEAELIEANAKAQAIKIVAEAKAYEIEKAAQDKDIYLRLKQMEVEMERLKRWNGQYPTTMMTLGGDGKQQPTLLLQTPPLPAETK